MTTLPTAVPPAAIDNKSYDGWEHAYTTRLNGFSVRRHTGVEDVVERHVKQGCGFINAAQHDLHGMRVHVPATGPNTSKLEYTFTEMTIISN